METTLNIQNDILKKINLAASSSGMSRAKIIILLIKKTMNDSVHPVMLGTSVRYQKRASPEDWHRFHLELRADDYEVFLDLRKFLKMSVSRILAYAVEKYLGTTINTITTDNYRIYNYIVVREVVDSIVCWKLFWGYPPRLETIGIP